MPYLFVWLYLMKCVFTCSIFVDSSTKRFLSVLSVFGKYFVLKNWNFQKSFLPCFGDLVAGKSSRELAGQFWQLVCEWKVQSRGLHRDFHGSAHDSLVGRPSNREKHLEHFFKILSLSVLAAWPDVLLATHFSHEKCVFCILRVIFKSCFQKFFIFPSCIIIIVHTFVSCSLFSLTPLSIRVKKGESIL